MTPQQTIQLLRDLEMALLDPGVRKSERVEELLALEFVEFGSSGHIWTRAETLTRLREESPVQVQASDFLIRLLPPDFAHVRYRTTHGGTPPVVALRSSLWRRDQESWKLSFHQGTPVPLRN